MPDGRTNCPITTEHPATLLGLNVLTGLLSPFGRLSMEVLFERDLNTSIPQVQDAPDVTFRIATEDDLEAITLIYSGDSYLYLGDHPAAAPESPSSIKRKIEREALEQYRLRMRRGEKCFLAVVGNEIAHVNWLCFQWAEAVYHHPLYLRNGEVYTTDAITVQEFRGKNIHVLVLRQMLQYARNAGYQRALTLTRAQRTGSFNAFNQLGWRILGKLLCFSPRGLNRSLIMRLSGDIEPILRQR